MPRPEGFRRFRDSLLDLIFRNPAVTAGVRCYSMTCLQTTLSASEAFLHKQKMSPPYPSPYFHIRLSMPVRAAKTLSLLPLAFTSNRCKLAELASHSVELKRMATALYPAASANLRSPCSGVFDNLLRGRFRLSRDQAKNRSAVMSDLSIPNPTHFLHRAEKFSAKIPHQDKTAYFSPESLSFVTCSRHLSSCLGVASNRSYWQVFDRMTPRLGETYPNKIGPITSGCRSLCTRGPRENALSSVPYRYA